MGKRTEVLAAATALVAEEGSAALTLEAVAQRAGISKGGLLYHFPNKKALVEGMVGLAVDTFEEALRGAEAANGDWLLGYLEATLQDLRTPAPLSGLLVAVAEDPGCLVPFRGALDRWYRRATLDYGPQAVPLLLVLDALWFHGCLQTLPELDARALEEGLRSLAKSCQKRGPS